MAKGDGSIKQLKDANGKPRRDLWEVRVSTGWNPVTKKYGVVTKRVHGTKADARRVRDEIRRQRENGIDLEAGKTSFGDFADKWLANRIEAGALSESTTVRYEQLIRQLKGYVGTVPVSEITPLMIDDLYSALKADRGISNTTLAKTHQLVKQILEQACAYDMILHNPAARIKPPKLDQVDRHSLTAEEAARLLNCLEDAEATAYANESAKESRRRPDGPFERGYIRGVTDISCALAARFTLATGTRRGETLAVTWGNLDLESGLVSIVASLTTSGKVKPPKSKAGVRTIALDAATVRSLARWHATQVRELGKIGFTVDADTPVFSDAKGGFICPNNFSRWWRKFTADNGFEGLKLHELRHTQATLLLAQGVDVKTVQNRLGHSNASITLNWYAHAVPENDRAAADMLGELLVEPPKKARIIRLGKTA